MPGGKRPLTARPANAGDHAPPPLKAPVTVRAPARLHFGFVNLSAHHGRQFGSAGVCLNGIATEMEFMPDERLRVCSDDPGADCEAVAKEAGLYCKRAGCPQQARIEVKQLIPPHQGLGSGTQMALTIGHGLGRLHGAEESSREIARHMGRGRRSGIGIAAFDQGGLIVDGGACSGRPPMVIARHEFPVAWHFVLLRDERQKGLHGEREKRAFSDSPKQTRGQAERLSHLVLMGLLPAVAESNFDLVARAIADIQTAMGDYYQSVQGGKFASGAVQKAVSAACRHGFIGVGQSSWGTTGFVLCRSRGQAGELRKEIDRLPGCAGLTTCVVNVDNGRPRGRDAKGAF